MAKGLIQSIFISKVRGRAAIMLRSVGGKIFVNVLAIILNQKEKVIRCSYGKKHGKNAFKNLGSGFRGCPHTPLMCAPPVSISIPSTLPWTSVIFCSSVLDLSWQQLVHRWSRFHLGFNLLSLLLFSLRCLLCEDSLQRGSTI